MEIKKSTVYTKTGDKGTTSLVGGTRIIKSDDRLEAYGSIDELNSFIGLLNCHIENKEVKDLLIFIQNKLFTIGSILATENEETALKYGCKINTDDIITLENEIDKIDSQLPKMRFFIIPGGNQSCALAHVCRTVCRRAERRIITLNSQNPIDDNLMMFINRLSDFLFVLSRKLTLEQNQSESFWNKGCD